MAEKTKGGDLKHNRYIQETLTCPKGALYGTIKAAH